MRNSSRGPRRSAPDSGDTGAVESMRPQILVVDDEPIVRDVVCRYLERESFRTIEAADGDEALRALLSADVHLVVLDVMLPGQGGLEVCRWIRARSDLPVIMLTGQIGRAHV